MTDYKGCRDISFLFREIEEISYRASSVVEQGVDNRCCEINVSFKDLVIWYELVTTLNKYFNSVITSQKVQGRDLVWHHLGLGVFSQFIHFIEKQTTHRDHTPTESFPLSLSYIETYFLFVGIRYYMGHTYPTPEVTAKWKSYSDQILKQTDNQLISLVGAMYISRGMEQFRKDSSLDSNSHQ